MLSSAVCGRTCGQLDHLGGNLTAITVPLIFVSAMGGHHRPLFGAENFPGVMRDHRLFVGGD